MMPNPGDEWAAGDISEEPMTPPDELTPETLRTLRFRSSATPLWIASLMAEHASAWENDVSDIATANAGLNVTILELQSRIEALKRALTLMTAERDALGSELLGRIGECDGGDL